MELRPIEYVCAVVDHGSFTRAAAALDVAQPSLSEGVHRLERELGVHLFERAGRTVRLTAAGEALLGPARQLLRDRDAALDVVAAVRELRRGTLDLVALPTLVAEPLAGLIGRFRSAHPGVSVHIADPEDNAALERRVAVGQSELGLTELPPRDDTFVTLRLERQEIVAVCPPGTKLARDGRLPVAELARLPLITTPAGTSTCTCSTARWRPPRATDDRGGDFAAGGDRPARARRRGRRLPAAASAEELATRGARAARLVPPLTRTVGLLHRAVPLSPAARAFVEMARPPRWAFYSALNVHFPAASGNGAVRASSLGAARQAKHHRRLDREDRADVLSLLPVPVVLLVVRRHQAHELVRVRPGRRFPRRSRRGGVAQAHRDAVPLSEVVQVGGGAHAQKQLLVEPESPHGPRIGVHANPR